MKKVVLRLKEPKVRLFSKLWPNCIFAFDDVSSVTRPTKRAFKGPLFCLPAFLRGLCLKNSGFRRSSYRGPLLFHEGSVQSFCELLLHLKLALTYKLFSLGLGLYKGHTYSLFIYVSIFMIQATLCGKKWCIYQSNYSRPRENSNIQMALSFCLVQIP